MTIDQQLNEIETRLRVTTNRLDSHSSYILDEVLPAVEKLRRDMSKLWIAEQRFADVEEALAAMASEIHYMKTGKKYNED